jgi:phosphotransferase system  glucose/maltose/N-acetylglucosamine-specific IIC component
MIDLIFGSLSRKDWMAMFSASLLLILLLLLTLLGKVMIWILIVFMLIAVGVSFYFSFVKKYPDDDKELEDMVSSLRKEMFGSKKK